MRRVLYFLLFLLSVSLITGCDDVQVNNEGQNNKTNKTNETNNVKLSNGVRLYKKYFLLEYGVGRSAYITFNDNGVCDIDFSAFDSQTNLSSTEVLYINYDSNNSPCIYTLNEEDIMSISWDGVVEEKYKYNLGTGQMQTAIIGSTLIIPNGLDLKYDKDSQMVFTENCTWKAINGQGGIAIISCVNE